MNHLQVLLQVLLFCALVASAVGRIHRHTWTITRHVEYLEGRTLTVNTINNKVQGPAVFVKRGDEARIKVINRMPETGVSIHWHGLDMKDAQIYDGPVGLVQCAIAPGESYTYKFKVDNSPGTYWYHTHSGMIPAGHDVIRGPLIILNDDESYPDDPYKYRYGKNNQILFYQDFYQNWFAVDHLMSLGGLRELGGFDAEGSFALTAPWSGGTLNGGNAHFLKFENGEYRFRVLNGGSVSPLHFSIDGYKLTIVATDGSDVEPYEVDAVQLLMGERYDVLVKFDVKEPQNVWMRARTSVVTADQQIKTTLQLRPDGKSKFLEGEATTEGSRDGVLMNCNYFADSPKCVSVTALKPVPGSFSDRPILDTEIHTADFYFTMPPKYGYFFQIDGGTVIQNAVPHKPIVMQDFDPAKDLTAWTNILDIPLHKTITIVLRSKAGIDHPIHFHGHKFEVLAQISRPKPSCFGHPGCPFADLDTSFSRPVSEMAGSPTRGVLKDTIMVPAFGAAVIRFNSDNPGAWFVHCHFDEHVDSGQGFVLNEGGFKAKSLPYDYPSCDYTGKIQGLVEEQCFCEDTDYLDPTWLCSKTYMCQHVQSEH